MMRIILLLALAAGVGSTTLLAAEAFDLVVYGGTAGGVITAVSGAREGLKTVLLEPRDHVGGMLTGGLSWSDIGKREVIGGYALEFAWRVGHRYKVRQVQGGTAWAFEPHVAESVLREMLLQAGVTVQFRQRLRENSGVEKTGTRVTSIMTERGDVIEGKVFADCSYEGDLMAQAGVSYTWGREGQDEYGESLAGVRDRTPKHQFTVDVDPRDSAGNLLPFVHSEPAAEPGSADEKVQAYNFRLIATRDPGNRIAWPRPHGYDPRRYEI